MSRTVPTEVPSQPGQLYAPRSHQVRLEKGLERIRSDRSLQGTDPKLMDVFGVVAESHTRIVVQDLCHRAGGWRDGLILPRGSSVDVRHDNLGRLRQDPDPKQLGNRPLDRGILSATSRWIGGRQQMICIGSRRENFRSRSHGTRRAVGPGTPSQCHPQARPLLTVGVVEFRRTPVSDESYDVATKGRERT